MDAVAALAHNVVTAFYDDLPHVTVAHTRKAILDTLGTLLGGYNAPGCAGVVGLVREWGGTPESTIPAHGFKSTVLNAAMVNSMMARALDFDNGMDRGMHPSASSVPTAIAVAERVGRIDGKSLIAAIALGEDVAARLNFALNKPKGFDPTGICMALGTAATAGKLMGLGEKQLQDALGLAFNQAGGSFQSNIDGALSVRMIQGFASHSGIISALLAQKGLTGTHNTIEGQYGFFNLFSGDGGNASLLTEGLGRSFWGEKAVFKRYPSCGATLGATEATLALVAEHGIDADNVQEISVEVSRSSYSLAGRPFEVREKPEVDAQFSLAYTIANALVRKSSRLEHFTEEAARDEIVFDQTRKVRTMINDDLMKAGCSQSTLLRLKTKDGQHYEQLVQYPKGRPENPLTMEELQDKFRECVARYPDQLFARKVDRIIEMVEHLEEVTDINDLVALLSVKEGVAC
ncbi:MAG: MmgE/PrpD family protein [Chloroflexota bacterium]|nr:MmgE/PrpD family protein [Chloroflexota bacterium]